MLAHPCCWVIDDVFILNLADVKRLLHSDSGQASSCRKHGTSDHEHCLFMMATTHLTVGIARLTMGTIHLIMGVAHLMRGTTHLIVSRPLWPQGQLVWSWKQLVWSQA